MSEAVRREMVESNPFDKMVVPLALQKRKKALSDDEIAAARTAVKKEAGWMATVLETMLYTGCRFNEAEISVEHIDLERDYLTLIDSKRDESDPRKQFTIPLPRDLQPIFKSIIV